MYLDAMTYLPDDILTKLDRAAMAASLETRVPFLDRDVLETAWRLPMTVKLHGGTTKWILRQVLYRHVPSALVERPKMGFGLPIGSWLRGPLRPWAEDLLAERRLRNQGLLDPAPVRAAWQQHVAGQRDLGCRSPEHRHFGRRRPENRDFARWCRGARERAGGLLGRRGRLLRLDLFRRPIPKPFLTSVVVHCAPVYGSDDHFHRHPMPMTLDPALPTCTAAWRFLSISREAVAHPKRAQSRQETVP